jgi:hypothetical protein
MNTRTLLIAAGAAVAIVVGGAIAFGTLQADEEPVVREGERTPDWAAAEQARIQQGGGQGGTVRPEGGATSPAQPGAVPVLIPGPAPGTATPQGGDTVRIQQTEDGYFAVITGTAYDMVIHGTRLFTVAPDNAPAPEGPRPTYTFADAEDGHSLSFSRFGVDYSIDFRCKLVPPGTACVTRDQAIAVAERLRVAS